MELVSVEDGGYLFHRYIINIDHVCVGGAIIAVLCPIYAEVSLVLQIAGPVMPTNSGTQLCERCIAISCICSCALNKCAYMVVFVSSERGTTNIDCSSRSTHGGCDLAATFIRIQI